MVVVIVVSRQPVRQCWAVSVDGQPRQTGLGSPPRARRSLRQDPRRLGPACFTPSTSPPNSPPSDRAAGVSLSSSWSY